ncbi:MAG: cytochrome c biogenesis protein CcdA, partial [Treponema sp.]|nr:cytochrome c biogenesis protein CcdA [Treponema sp.]
MSQDFSLFLIFTAGLLSFLSPCVLPLIPSYIGILGGVGFGEGNRPRLIRAAVGFVLGFSAVFIAMGILVSATFLLMGDVTKYINWAAGIIVIVLGLNVIFDFLSFLNYEKRPFLQKWMAPGIRGVPAAFIAGAAFGTGWTPCVGPILTAILLLAGQ